MKLRNKRNGEIKEFVLFDGKEMQSGLTLENLVQEWEDAPKEPKEDGLDNIITLLEAYSSYDNERYPREIVEKLKAFRKLKDKGFRFVGWCDSVSDNNPDMAFFKLDEGAWGTDTCEDLDLLFGSLVYVEHKLNKSSESVQEKPKTISKLAKVEIAPEDYREGDKDLFTWEEAMEAAKKVGDGWRLPTKDEWELIDKEFADGDSKKIQKELGLTLGGYSLAGARGGSYGRYWSSTASSYDYAYDYYLYTSSTNPQCSNYKYFGFSVRLVRDLEVEE